MTSHGVPGHQGKGVSGRANFVEKLRTITKRIPEIELALIKIFLLLGTFLTLSKWLWSEICQLLK
jgi:hypothetical protein